MSTITDQFQHAQLGAAAYANYFDVAGNLIATDAQSIAALTNANAGGKFTQAAAEAFVKHWKVVDQFTAPTGLISGGFSGTVFESLDNPGQFVFAARGSEMAFNDWVGTNFGDIGADGIAVKQGIDMYNYYLRLTAAPGSLVPQYLEPNGSDQAKYWK